VGGWKLGVTHGGLRFCFCLRLGFK
jgi:hypothetical protein